MRLCHGIAIPLFILSIYICMNLQSGITPRFRGAVYLTAYEGGNYWRRTQLHAILPASLRASPRLTIIAFEGVNATVGSRTTTVHLFGSRVGLYLENKLTMS